ncbi:hypothetical protein OsJ_10935 [Oryza sativa Japonica Group]|uniref:Uncharacterized protein n=1 Tax=Oryza sativa subsp. japonica TaxID=39947 RepID=B9F8J5_ORYSJ|nr:hypothetical protein OsJ_10935 [Oryza sativa Japonica Group]
MGVNHRDGAATVEAYSAGCPRAVPDLLRAGAQRTLAGGAGGTSAGEPDEHDGGGVLVYLGGKDGYTSGAGLKGLITNLLLDPVQV